MVFSKETLLAFRCNPPGDDVATQIWSYSCYYGVLLCSEIFCHVIDSKQIADCRRTGECGGTNEETKEEGSHGAWMWLHFKKG